MRRAIMEIIAKVFLSFTQGTLPTAYEDLIQESSSWDPTGENLFLSQGLLTT